MSEGFLDLKCECGFVCWSMKEINICPKCGEQVTCTKPKTEIGSCLVNSNLKKKVGGK